LGYRSRREFRNKYINYELLKERYTWSWLAVSRWGKSGWTEIVLELKDLLF
jgi:hypothetical protein